MAPPKVHKQYDQSQLRQAVKMVREKKLSMAKAAERFKVPRSTIADKVHMRSWIDPVARTALTPEEEERIVNWMTTSCRRGCKKWKADISKEVQRILNSEGRTSRLTDNKPGTTWMKMFLQRHPGLMEKMTKVPQFEEFQGRKEKVRAWFQETEANLYKDGIDIHSIDPNSVFNAKTMGFFLDASGQVILTDSNNKGVPTTKWNNIKRIMVLNCASAAGQLLPPAVTFPSESFTLSPEDNFTDATVAFSKSGYIEQEGFCNWLSQRFIPDIEALPRPILLFCDELMMDFISMEVHELFEKHNVVYHLLPTPAPFIVQPLDLVFQAILKNEWGKAVDEFVHHHLLEDNIVKTKNFMSVFRETWIKCSNEEHLQKAFEISGFWPWNPSALDYDKYEERFMRSEYHNRCKSKEELSQYESMDVSSFLSSLARKDRFMVAPDRSNTSVEPETVNSEADVKQESSTVITDQLQASSQNSSLDIAKSVDNLLDHIIATGWSASDMCAVRMRQWSGAKPEPGEHLYRKYLELYKQVVPYMDFDSLPSSGSQPND